CGPCERDRYDQHREWCRELECCLPASDPLPVCRRRRVRLADEVDTHARGRRLQGRTHAVRPRDRDVDFPPGDTHAPYVESAATVVLASAKRARVQSLRG